MSGVGGGLSDAILSGSMCSHFGSSMLEYIDLKVVESQCS